MKYADLTKEQLQSLLDAQRKEYEEIAAKGSKVDIARGKPCFEQAKIAYEMLEAPSAEQFPKSTLNYGGLEGIPEMRALFGEMLGLQSSEIFVGGNSSLNLMYDTIQRGLQFGFGGNEPWVASKIKFLCPVPGYDRHFGICQHFGIEMINIPMDDNGPNMDLVERYVAADESIKGIWCVPKYSNPTGAVYSDEVVNRLATMQTAAKDFRIFWDNAYCVHDLTDESVPLADIMACAKKAGNQDRIFEFTSTSKITLAGSGVACLGSSEANIKEALSHITFQTIGYDKVNQFRHFTYLKSMENVAAIMKKQREVIAPKFKAILDAFENSFGEDSDIAKWTNPKGGYFISLNVMPGCAKEVGRLCKEAGLTLTPVGASYPYGKDDSDSNIRIAPTFTSESDLEVAIEILVCCVKLACIGKLAEDKQ